MLYSKNGVRILAPDDAPFKKNDKKDKIVGIIGREYIIEGVISFDVSIDGDDSTEEIINAVKRSRFSPQIKALALNGIALAGLNVIDVEKINQALKIPIIMFTRRRPRRTLFNAAIKKSAKGDYRKRIDTVNRVYKNIKIHRKIGFFVQVYPANVDVNNLVENSVYFLRLANLVASGITRGESKGRI